MKDEIFCSSYSASIYISQILGLPAERRTIFALGESGLETELAAEELAFIGGTDPSLRRDMTAADYTAIASGEALNPSVGVVLAGLDFHINYLKLSLAFAYIQRGAVFLATNLDSSLPSSNWLFPGAGSIGVAPLVKMTNQEPLALGKPSQAMMDAILGKFKFDKKRACMVGDRLDTDIKFGIEGALGGTLLVLTGVAKHGDWDRDESVKPAFLMNKLGDLLDKK